MEVKVFPQMADPVILVETYEQFFDGHCLECGATDHRYVNHRTRTVQTMGRWGQPYRLEKIYKETNQFIHRDVLMCCIFLRGNQGYAG